MNENTVPVMQVNAGRRGLAQKPSNITNLGETLTGHGLSKRVRLNSLYNKNNDINSPNDGKTTTL